MRTRPPSQHRRPSQEAMNLRKLSTISEDTLTPINGPFQFDTADVMLVSSDGLSFKVHTSRLGRCSSRIFRTALPQPSPSLPTPPSSPTSPSTSKLDLPEIHFVDPQLENGITLSLFLHLTYSLPLPVPTLPVYFKAYETLVDFLVKWECAYLYPILGSAVKGWVEDGLISSSKGLKIGDILGNDRLMIESIKRGGEYTWTGKVIEDPNKKKDKVRSAPDDETGQSSSNHNSKPICSSSKADRTRFDIMRDGLPGEASLDLTAVPYEYFVSLSDDVKFSLLRASRVGRKDRQDVDWEKVAVEFQRALGELRE
ncbi:hypothetical protein L486_06624 [Kwoniella mangroviensis CBS 10435]|uniref:BTB domain-containing protein n=1 Tax=Kwoniella mangroviensis CBS 10435 TaxID=1331196 RepID=A0A1B9IJL4_9TREE|nr:hypothetical protein L486_06624 [Kwoniella mangroviensis CBS 10435]